MRVYFLDTSAVVKRYVVAPGSEWIRNLCREGTALLVIASLAGPETVSAIRRKAREGGLSDDGCAQALREFRRDFAREYARIHLRLRIIEEAMRLLSMYPLKASDGIQLATSLAARRAHAGRRATFRFVAADIPLLDAARRAGLQTDNPNAYS